MKSRSRKVENHVLWNSRCIVSTDWIHLSTVVFVLQFYWFSWAKWIKVCLVCSTTQSKISGRVWEQIPMTHVMLSSDSELSQTPSTVLDIDEVMFSDEWYTKAIGKKSPRHSRLARLECHFWHDTQPHINSTVSTEHKGGLFSSRSLYSSPSCWGDF